MMLVTNYELRGYREGRAVIRCLECGLVQFRPLELCRRCHIQMEHWIQSSRSPGRKQRQLPPELDFGHAVRFWREVYQMPQCELARRMGIRRQRVSKLENHHMRAPVLDTCCRYAEALGIPMRLLVLTAQGLGRKA